MVDDSDTNGSPSVQHILWQVLHWEVPGFKRGPGRLHTNWRSTVNEDLLRMGITWEDAEVAAQNRSEWHRSVARCIQLDAGWIKVNDDCVIPCCYVWSKITWLSLFLWHPVLCMYDSIYFTVSLVWMKVCSLDLTTVVPPSNLTCSIAWTGSL